jgi:transcriptional regulator with XRE-family HTH domain
MSPSDRIFQLMAERGLKSVDVSKATGITLASFTDWKKGKNDPSYKARVKLANYFGVSIKYLSGETDDPTPTSESADDVHIEILARAARKMTSEEKEKLIAMAKVMFKKAFDE